MEDCLAPVTETWHRPGVGIELPCVAPRAQVHDPIAPTHDAETQDRLTHVTWADDLFLVAKNTVEAQAMTSELVDALRNKTDGCCHREGSATFRIRTMFGSWDSTSGPRGPVCGAC